MKVSVEATSELGRRLTVEIPSADVAAKANEHLKKVANTIKIDGFRKGKVPESFLKQKYSKQIHGETVMELISSSLQDALKQQQLNPVDTPVLEDIKDEQGKDLTYVAKFEVFPTFELADFKQLELTRLVADLNDEDIDQGIKSLQEQLATWQPATDDYEAKNGDKLVIDYVGSIDDIPFDGGSAKNAEIEIGAKRFIPGFEETLIGVKTGEQRNLAVTFPENYGAKELAGKPAVFAVTVHSVSSKELAKVDEDFAKNIGIEDGDVSKIRDKITENMHKYLASAVQEDLRNQAIVKLVEINPITIPSALLDKEKESMLQNRKGQDPSFTADQQQLEQIEKEATKKIRLGLILNEIISKHNIKLDEARLVKKFQDLSAMFGGNMDLIKRIYKDTDRLMDNLKSTVLTEQAVDLAVEYATLQDIASTFYDIAKRST